MAWVRIDDGFADHPKIVAAGPIAALIQVRALCYSSRHLTDGFIPDAAVEGLLTGFKGIGIETGGTADFSMGNDVEDFDWPGHMVKSELWHRTERKSGNGYTIHGYLDYNFSKAQINQLRETKRKAGQAGGIASAEARAIAPGIPSGIPMGEAKGKLIPSPSPSPSVSQETSLREEGANGSKPHRSLPLSKLSDDDWFAELKKTYTWLDVDREHAKAKAWLMTHPGRQFTRRFFVNWLNKVERPVVGVDFVPTRISVP